MSACTFDPPGAVTLDAQAPEGGVLDGGIEGGVDMGLPPQDAGASRDARVDAGGQTADGGQLDAGVIDGGAPDTAVPDSGVPDTAVPDSGPPDTGALDGGVVPDAGVTLCGDGRIEGAEQCDDGNLTANDGCTACVPDNNWVCVLAPSRCTPLSLVQYVDRNEPNCDDGDEEGAVTGGNPASPVWCSIDLALQETPAPQLVIVQPGNYRGTLFVELTTEVLIYAPQNATLASDSGPALQVRRGGQAIVSGFTIRGTSSGGGVRIESNGSALTLWDNIIGPSNARGVDLKNGATVVMARNTVHDNTAGGVYLDSSDGYTVENNLIVSNGSNSTDFGGVRIKKTANAARLVNNTIADNTSGTEPAGVRCEVSANLINDVVWNNAGMGTTGISTACQAQHCLLQAIAPGAGNLAADPQFVGAQYLLGPNSPARDAADPAGVRPIGPAPIDDFSRNPRPLGLFVDMGAHETP